MTELRFHRELYAEKAVREAVATFIPHAEIACAEGAQYWVVTVSAAREEREKRIARELGNFALGLTVRGRGAS